MEAIQLRSLVNKRSKRMIVSLTKKNRRSGLSVGAMIVTNATAEMTIMTGGVQTNAKIHLLAVVEAGSGDATVKTAAIAGVNGVVAVDATVIVTTGGVTEVHAATARNTGVIVTIVAGRAASDAPARNTVVSGADATALPKRCIRTSNALISTILAVAPISTGTASSGCQNRRHSSKASKLWLKPTCRGKSLTIYRALQPNRRSFSRPRRTNAPGQFWLRACCSTLASAQAICTRLF